MEYYPPGGLVSATDIRSAIRATLNGTDLQTTPSSVTLVDGLLITYTPTSANGSSYALGLNGSATKYVLRAYNATAGYGSIQSGDIVANCPVVLQYCKDFDAWILINRTYLATSDIPSTLGATTFTGAVAWTGTQSSAGSSVANAFRDSSGNLWVNTASGAVLVFTAGGSGSATLGASNFYCPPLIAPYPGGDLAIGAGGSGNANALSLSGCANPADFTRGSAVLLFGKSAYYGALKEYAPLAIVTASTAHIIHTWTSGDYIRLELIGLNNGVGVTINTAGTVGFFSLIDGGSPDSTFVNSSSPTSGQVGVYLDGSNNVCVKPGSSYTGKLAAFVKVAKA